MPVRSAKRKRAFEIDPGNVDAVSLLASKKLADGDADGALKLLNSFTVDPKDRNTNLCCKRCRSMRGKAISQRPKAFCEN